jgi:hypothetical protein
MEVDVVQVSSLASQKPRILLASKAAAPELAQNSFARRNTHLPVPLLIRYHHAAHIEEGEDAAGASFPALKLPGESTNDASLI